jgi:hypothetical protein
MVKKYNSSKKYQNKKSSLFMGRGKKCKYRALAIHPSSSIQKRPNISHPSTRTY